MLGKVKSSESWKTSGFSGLRRLALGEDAALVGGHHVLDVDEGVRATAVLQQLEGVLDDVTYPAAAVGINALAQVDVNVLVQVAHGEQLAVEGDESLTHTGACEFNSN